MNVCDDEEFESGENEPREGFRLDIHKNLPEVATPMDLGGSPIGLGLLSAMGFLLLSRHAGLALLGVFWCTATLSPEPYQNPFIVERHFLASKIVGPYLNSTNAGATDAPKRLTLSLVVEDDSKLPIEGLAASHFRFSASPSRSTPSAEPPPHKQQNIKASLYEANAKYWFDLDLPTVDREGFYDLTIRLHTGQPSKPTIKRVVRRAFAYQNRKVNLLFLVDNSASMLESDPNNKRFNAITGLVRNPKFERHLASIAIVTFSDEAKIHLPFTSASNKAAIEQAAKNIRVGKRTHIPDAFKKSLELFATTPLSGRQAVIFLTDGVSTYPYNDEHKALLERGVVLHTVGYANQHAYDEAFLRRLSKEGKGLFLRADENVVGRVYESLLLRTQKIPEDIVLYPLHRRYSPYELIVVDYRSSLGSALNVSLEKVGYAAVGATKTSVDKPLKILRHRPNEVALHASLEGLYRFELVFWSAKRLRKRQPFQTRVAARQKPFKLPTMLHFNNIGALGDIRTFGITNQLATPLLVRFEHLPSSKQRSGGAVQFDHPLSFMAPNEQVYKMVFFRAKQLLPGMVDDYLLVRTSDRTYIHNFSFEVGGDLHARSGQSMVARASPTWKWALMLLVGVFVALGAAGLARATNKKRARAYPSQTKQIKL